MEKMNEVTKQSEIKLITGLVTERDVTIDNICYKIHVLEDMENNKPQEGETVIVRLDPRPGYTDIPIFVFGSKEYDEVFNKIDEHVSIIQRTNSIFLPRYLSYYVARIKTEQFNILLSDPKNNIPPEKKMLRESMLSYKKLSEETQKNNTE